MTIGGKKMKRNYMKKVSNHIDRSGEDVVLKADNIAILDLTKVLALQEKYTTLQCECMRFADYVMNLTHNRDTQAIRFDDEYLNMAGNMLFKSFGRIPNPDQEEIIKELKK